MEDWGKGIVPVSEWSFLWLWIFSSKVKSKDHRCEWSSSTVRLWVTQVSCEQYSLCEIQFAFCEWILVLSRFLGGDKCIFLPHCHFLSRSDSAIPSINSGCFPWTLAACWPLTFRKCMASSTFQQRDFKCCPMNQTTFSARRCFRSCVFKML
jgi:hypothetical protein